MKFENEILNRIDREYLSPKIPFQLTLDLTERWTSFTIDQIVETNIRWEIVSRLQQIVEKLMPNEDEVLNRMMSYVVQGLRQGPAESTSESARMLQNARIRFLGRLLDQLYQDHF